MTAMSEDRKTQYKEGVEIAAPVGIAKKIYSGSLVVLDGTTKHAEEAADAASKVFHGVAMEQADNSAGLGAAINVRVRRRGLFLFKIASALQADVGKPVFALYGDEVALSTGVTYGIMVGQIAELESATKVWVDIAFALDPTDVATHIADPSAAHAGTAISLAAGGLGIPENVQLAEAELYQTVKSILKMINIPLSSFMDVAGTQLTTFSNGASAQPGLELTNSKAYSIRWNNHATPLGIMTQFLVPNDADITANMTLKIKASKVGATVGDAVTFGIALFNQVTGALHDADTDFGGATGAMTGDATSKTVQQVTRTLALADLAAVGSNVTLTITPTAGTLGTDDLCLHAVWIEYKGKVLTS